MCASRRYILRFRVFASHACQSRAEQNTTEQNRAEQSRAEQGRAEQGRAGQSRAGQSRAEHNRAEHNRAEHNRAEHNRAEQSRLAGCMRAPSTHEASVRWWLHVPHRGPSDHHRHNFVYWMGATMRYSWFTRTSRQRFRSFARTLVHRVPGFSSVARRWTRVSQGPRRATAYPSERTL
jgi:predicted DCC family thiol-disulfide oxidoreductase YuxK